MPARLLTLLATPPVVWWLSDSSVVVELFLSSFFRVAIAQRTKKISIWLENDEISTKSSKLQRQQCLADVNTDNAVCSKIKVAAEWSKNDRKQQQQWVPMSGMRTYGSDAPRTWLQAWSVEGERVCPVVARQRAGRTAKF